MDKSTSTIEIAPRRFGVDWKEYWTHRELLYFLTLREIKVRYKQTAIGLLWVVLQPIVSTAILAVIFSSFARFDSVRVPYPIFVLSGIVMWLFVYTAITTASNSFVNNQNLVTKVYFPRLIVPISSTLAGFFDLLVTLPILFGLMIYFGIFPTANLVAAPLFLFLAFAQTASFGILFSALNVRFRDVKFALPFLLQIWMLSSPIFYPADVIPAKWKLVFAINPLTGIIEGWRSSLFGTPIDWPVVLVSVASAAVIAVVSIMIFRSMEDDFADYL